MNLSMKKAVSSVVAACALLCLANQAYAASAVNVDDGRITVAYQNGLAYLPIEHIAKFYYEEARKLGLSDVHLSTKKVGGPGEVISGLKKGEFDLGTVGANAVPTLWADKAQGGFRMASSLCDMPLELVTNNPKLKSVTDLKRYENWVAVPTRRTSIQATLLSMAWEQAYGPGTYFLANGLEVGVAHPYATDAILSESHTLYVGEDGIGSITLDSHFSSDPYLSKEKKDKRVHTILSSYDILGGKSSFQTVVGSNSFYESHPKTYQAFVVALERAMDYIKSHKEEVAKGYTESNPGEKESVKDVLAQLNNPNTDFTTTPHNVMKYADFLYKTGDLKKKPQSWKDMAFPNLHSKSGS